MWIHRLLLAACLYILAHIQVTVGYDCPCGNKAYCEHPTKDLGIVKEVFVFSNGSTDVHLWRWDTITTLVVPAEFEITNISHASTMCVARSHGRKFGITVNMNLTGTINETSEEARVWIDGVVKKQRDWHAEVININLLPYFKSDIYSTQADHLALAHILASVRQEIDEVHDVPVRLTCVVPWEPPCATGEATCYFSKQSSDTCDYYIINPDSFIDIDDMECRARATIPFSHLIYGIGEYNSHQIPVERIIIGVPWHGYDFTCTRIYNDICTIPMLNVEDGTQTKCDFSSRVAVSHGELLAKYALKKLDNLYHAPHLTYNTDKGEHHQIWFENQQSLTDKYRLVNRLKLRGLAVFYGDDLSTATTNVLMNENEMWSWVAHEFLYQSTSTHSSSLHYADAIAGASIGCLFLGLILGVTFTCIGLRSRIKKPKEPFSRASDTQVEEFMDDDPNL